MASIHTETLRTLDTDQFIQFRGISMQFTNHPNPPHINIFYKMTLQTIGHVYAQYAVKKKDTVSMLIPNRWAAVLSNFRDGDRHALHCIALQHLNHNAQSRSFYTHGY
jgi:hypothetical protein